MFRFKYTVNWIVVISLGLGVTWTNISSKQYSVPWTKTLLELWVPTEMTIHNTQLGITECIYFLSNCDWCTTLNIFFFFWWRGNIWRSLGTMILFIRPWVDEAGCNFGIMVGLEDILMVFSKHYNWLFLLASLNNAHDVIDTLAHDFPYTSQTAQYLALDPKKHLYSIIKGSFFKKDVIEA